jgi:hypothetical protein
MEWHAWHERNGLDGQVLLDTAMGLGRYTYEQGAARRCAMQHLHQVA